MMYEVHILMLPSSVHSFRFKTFWVVEGRSSVLTLAPGGPGDPRGPIGPCQSDTHKIRHCIITVHGK